MTKMQQKATCVVMIGPCHLFEHLWLVIGHENDSNYKEMRDA
jgi:hypothetical protein